MARAKERNLPPFVYVRKGHPYFIRRGYRCARLRGDPGSPEFEENYRRALAMPPRTGEKFISSHGDDYFARMEKGARTRAKKYGRDYSLPDGWMREQYERQNGKCAISGIPFVKDRDKHAPWAPSIDRKRSDKGYTPENCQLVCYIVNCGKNQFTMFEFAEMCKKVAARYQANSASPEP